MLPTQHKAAIIHENRKRPQSFVAALFENPLGSGSTLVSFSIALTRRESDEYVHIRTRLPST